MQVSLASIHIAYIVVFGAELPGNKPYATAAAEIKMARQDWATVMRIAEEVKDIKRDNGDFLPYPEQAVTVQERLAKITLLERGIDAWNAARPIHNMPRKMVLEKMAAGFDRLSPYGFAKKYGVLVDNSAEDFASEFMAAFNKEAYTRY